MRENDTLGCAAAIDEERRAEMDNYLKTYGFQRKLLRLSRYERTYFGVTETEDDLPGETALARARMFEVRHFIMSLPNGNEKLLLYYHYIRGETVEKCAELLEISRAGGYRLKKRALTLAALHKVKQAAEE